MTVVAPPICLVCTRYRSQRDDGTFLCDAFPSGTGIPEEIIMSQFDHRQPHAGDHDKQFIPADASAAEYAATLFRDGQ